MFNLRIPGKLAVSLLLSFAAGAIGSLATFSNITTWYAKLAKPVFNPPNWIFGPVWTVLYLLMGISLYLVWVAKYKKPRQRALTLFGVQLVLNTLWSVVFFGFHWLWGGAAVIVVLLIALIVAARTFLPISKTAALLLLPYIFWVSFATVLNVSVALLN